MTFATRGFTLLLLPALLWQPALDGQVSADWKRCNMDSLATWNCAMYYSGTVAQTSTLKVSGKDEVTTVTATIAAGRVTCRVKPAGAPEFEGPGMLVVGHATTENAGEYDFQVWCPEEAGKRPRRGDYPIMELADLQAADYGKLDGKSTYEHPDADEANGVSGSVTVTWHLVRQ